MPRFIETIGWLVFYSAFSAFVLTAHAASPIYSAIFIDRTAADWLPDATRRYVPSEVILGKQFSPYFAKGWWPPETNRRWGKGERNTIVVQPTRSLAYGSRVTGRIGALSGGGRADQTVIIEVNGIEVDRREFKGKHGEVVTAFDAALAGSYKQGESIEIAFVVPGSTSPFLLHANDDFRQRGVSFYELALVPGV
jgi:hypothetical protein